MRTPARAALSRVVGWIADRRIPGPLRAPVYRGYARFTGADLTEMESPLAEHASLSEFFVRRLRDGARPIDAGADAIVSPCDGTVQSSGPVARGSLLQAKGRSYRLAELLASEEDAAACEGGFQWTIYLSPRDYHRVHAPETCELASVRRIPGARFSVAPSVLDARLVLPINERAVFRLETSRGILWMVMVGATNVGRIRIVGEGDLAPELAPGLTPGPAPRRFRRGEEVARFEMGSTVVLVAAREAAESLASIVPGASVRLGQRIAAWRRSAGALRA
jgi:phosphatidylserine decarboxylase